MIKHRASPNIQRLENAVISENTSIHPTHKSDIHREPVKYLVLMDSLEESSRTAAIAMLDRNINVVMMSIIVIIR